MSTATSRRASAWPCSGVRIERSTRTPESYTVPVALASLQGDRLMDAPTTNAGALISLIPAVIFFFIFQRTLTRGVTAGAVK